MYIVAVQEGNIMCSIPQFAKFIWSQEHPLPPGKTPPKVLKEGSTGIQFEKPSYLHTFYISIHSMECKAFTF